MLPKGVIKLYSENMAGKRKLIFMGYMVMIMHETITLA